ncbi:hypothetical protein T4B_6212 [Trichinella pseudospiralis]|uniref:Uncharacterized protein n=1 Tax=Trichinella pseudospiralis TaxID=6337 RepID=A0A0V1KAH9_TRIPS|nr:hypothetical protein T4B_6212 [Trichinella pseudospiralis]KRZ44188.1 hypothetical protein T4C_9666 [Trichinella pseudospiralis]
MKTRAVIGCVQFWFRIGCVGTCLARKEHGAVRSCSDGDDPTENNKAVVDQPVVMANPLQKNEFVLYKWDGITRAKEKPITAQRSKQRDGCPSALPPPSDQPALLKASDNVALLANERGDTASRHTLSAALKHLITYISTKALREGLQHVLANK